MRLSAKKGHEDRTWRVTTVIDTTENHTGHFDSVVRAWPPWLPFTLVDAVVALQAPQGQDPSPSASGSAGGWWPSADSISGNGLSWREPSGSPEQFDSRDMPRPTPLKVKQLCRVILPPERSLDPLHVFCCTSVPRSAWSTPVTALWVLIPRGPPVNCPHTDLHLSLFPRNCCSVAQSSPTLPPHGRQHTRPPCPSPSPGVCPSSESFKSVMPSNHFISAVLFSFCLQSFPSSRCFPPKVLEFQHQSFQWVFIIQLASWGTYPKTQAVFKIVFQNQDPTIGWRHTFDQGPIAGMKMHI